MYKMSLETFQLSLLFTAQNYCCTKMSFLFIIKFIEYISVSNMQIIL